jgi:hypothetical protein
VEASTETAKICPHDEPQKEQTVPLASFFTSGLLRKSLLSIQTMYEWKRIARIPQELNVDRPIFKKDPDHLLYLMD